MIFAAAPRSTAGSARTPFKLVAIIVLAATPIADHLAPAAGDRGAAAMSKARVYADINVLRPKEYWTTSPSPCSGDARPLVLFSYYDSARIGVRMGKFLGHVLAVL
ncbi:Casein kinase II subunit alpha [Platanthera guangdongensis]|uniref:Casein kinase II subunit alpha n=1 Tax=Platanthera guangdongensis TaxID=2320717 RepID=A0ABR2LEG0_9ASPA